MLQGPLLQELSDYLLSGQASLHVRTTEKTCFLTKVEDIAAGLPGDGGA